MRIILCGGGTAGHVNPAIAIAEEIRRQDKNAKILFVGREGGKENSLVTNLDFDIKTLSIKGLKRGLALENLSRIKTAIKARKDAEKIIDSFMPEIILGTGGYVCWPVIEAGHKMGIPTVIHESNITPGLTTKLLAKKCNLVLLNHEATKDKIQKGVAKKVVGNPLRREFLNIDRLQARKSLHLNESDVFILSFGGSIGANKINECVLGLMIEYSSKQSSVMHIHGCGERYYEEMKKQLPNLNESRCQILPYIHNMPQLMHAADIVICRCGSVTLSEISQVGVASILIPSPNVTGNHQYKNAKHLQDMGAAMMIEEKSLDKESLIVAVKALKNDKNGRKKKAKSIKSLSSPNSAKIIVNELKLLINTNNKG